MTALPTRTSSIRTPARRGWRVGAAVVGATALVLLPAGAASAHVRVIPDSTSGGGYAKLTFRVPNESETAGTVKLSVALPTTTPLTAVRSLPLAGWKATIVRGALPAPVTVDGAKITEAPVSVVWTAAPGTTIKPGEFQEFALSVGPLPADGTDLVLPATQTYSDGEVVAWDDAPKAGGEEAEHPVPSLVTTAAEDEDAVTVAPAAAPDASAGHEAAAADVERDATADPLARWLGGLGLLLGASGLVLALTRRAAARPRS